MNLWHLPRTPVLVAASALLAGSAGLVLWWKRSHRGTAEDKERLRRTHLLQHGRTIDATVLDWSEQPELQSTQILRYRYAIGGVVYESAQDLRHLHHAIEIDSAFLGMPASVRYDPQNPANSIIAAETWNGLYRANSTGGRLAHA